MSRMRRLAFPSLAALAALVVLTLSAGPGASATNKRIHFKSPSGNIQCQLSYDNVNCLLKENTWPRLKPKPAYCDVDWAPTDTGMYLNRKANRWIVQVGGCRGDIGPMCYRDDPCVVLGYGQSVKSFIRPRGSGGPVLGIRCSSATNGITCIKLGPKPGARGFRVAREGYVVLR